MFCMFGVLNVVVYESASGYLLYRFYSNRYSIVSCLWK